MDASIIRPALQSDAPILADIELSSFDHPWSLSQISSQLAAPTNLSFLCEAGYIMGSLICGEAEILRLAVLPSRRGEGLAKKLVGAFLCAARESEGTVCFLEVAAKNVAARSLYLACGFCEAGLRKKYYTDGDDAILMNRSRPCPPKDPL